MEQDPPESLDLKIAEVAQKLRVSKVTVSVWVKHGLFPNAYKIGNQIRIPIQDLENAKQSVTEPKQQKLSLSEGKSRRQVSNA